MSVKIGSGIVKDGLILHLDAADSSNYVLSEVEVLVVGAGGGGGVCYGGGGGGGAVIYNNSYAVTPGSAINVTIGNGGTNRVNVVGDGGPGGNTVFGNITAPGGGYGGGNCGNVGGGGASGGGGSSTGSSNTSGGSGIIGLGYDGESSIVAGGGGGGGAGGQGYGRHGGKGLQYSISGTNQYYGGGGSGGGPEIILGGLGGGGLSGTAIPAGGADSGGANGVSNTGGGGGGSIISGSTGTSGVGGSGIVIVRYPGPQKATGGNTLTNINGYTIHTFTSAGTFTPLTAPANSAAVYGLQDLSGNTNTGVAFNGPTYGSVNRGTIIFNGTNNYIDVTTNLGVLSGYTFCHWSRRDAENRMPIGWRAGPTFYQFGDNSWFYTHGGATGEYYYPKSVSIPLGTWGFYCITYDGTAVRIYRNGVFEGSQATTGTADWRNGFRIGYWAGGGNYWHQGGISQVQMYTRALTQSEVSQNFNAQRWRFGI